MSKTGVLYIAESNGMLKIGHSSSLSNRISILKCSAPDLELIWSSEHMRNRQEVEREVHRVMKPFKYKGEWFKCDVKLAVSNCESVIKAIGEMGSGDFDDDLFDSKLIDARCTAAGYLCRVLHDENLDMISEYIKHSDATNEQIKNFMKKDKTEKIIEVFKYFAKVGFALLKTDEH